MPEMELDERRRFFLEQHIRDRSREALAHELFGIYLHLRSIAPDITDESPDDTWPMDLHLADVLQRINRQLGVEGQHG